MGWLIFCWNGYLCSGRDVPVSVGCVLDGTCFLVWMSLLGRFCMSDVYSPLSILTRVQLHKYIWMAFIYNYHIHVRSGIESRLRWDFPHPSSPTLGPTESNEVSLPGVKRPGPGSKHSLPSRAKVKERVELYLYSPLGLHGMFYLHHTYVYVYILIFECITFWMCNASEWTPNLRL
jgi:hypothetical protein